MGGMDEENVECIYTEVLLLKKNEILSFVAKWLESEDIMLCEVRPDTDRHILHCSPLYVGAKI